MGMFKGITQELGFIRDAIVTLTEAHRKVSAQLREGPSGSLDQERLSALEGRIESILGMVEAGLTKADALKQTALAAESRALGAQRRAEKLAAAEGSPEGAEAIVEAYAALGIVQNGDASRVQEAEVLSVQPYVASESPRARAVRMKYGV